MSFLLDTLEGMLKLTDDEKATVNAALPTLHKWMYMLNKQWDTLSDAVTWLANSKSVALRLLQDGRNLGPIAEEVLAGGGSIFESGTAYGAVNDAKSVIDANPKLVAALTADYNHLVPLIAQIQSDSSKPEVQACIRLVQTKMGHQNVSLHALLSRLVVGNQQMEGDSTLSADAGIVRGPGA